MLITVKRQACLCPTRHAPTYRSSNGYMACISAGDNAAKRWVGIDGNVAAKSMTDIVGMVLSGVRTREDTSGDDGCVGVLAVVILEKGGNGFGSDDDDRRRRGWS